MAGTPATHPPRHFWHAGPHNRRQSRRRLACRPDVDRLEPRSVPSLLLGGQPAGAEPGPRLPLAAGRPINDAIVGTVDVVLIDQSLPDVAALDDAVVAGAVIFPYDGRVDPAERILTQVARWAEEDHRRIGTLAIVGHAVPGAFQLGADWVSSTTLDATAGAWQLLASELALSGDVRLFGCALAATPDGRALIDRLAALLGVGVSASDDPTGATDLGGDWSLEYRTGPVASPGPRPATFDPTALARWNGLLGTATLAPSQDAYITNGSSINHGTSTSLVVDRSGGSIGDGRALLQFDLSAIPAGATITDATLTLQATQNGGAFNLNIYRLTQPWAEGSSNGTTGAANWTQRLTGTNWSTSGGSYDPAVVATLSTGTIGPHGWNITALVQGWYSGSIPNDGLLLGSPDTGTTTITYDSREGAIPPRLVVTYSGGADVPAISSLDADTLRYTARGGAIVIDQAPAASVVAPPTVDFSGGTLSATFTSGSDPSEDRLGVRHEGDGTGQIGVTGAIVSYGGLPIGRLTGGAGGIPLIVTLNAAATPAAVTALVRNLTFENINETSPTLGLRTIRLDLTDGVGTTSPAIAAHVVVGPPTAPTTLWVSSTTGATLNDGTSWGSGSIVQVAGSGLSFAPATSAGTFSPLFSLDGFADDGQANACGLYVVQTTLTVGSGANTATLLPGDVLFSTASKESFQGVAGSGKGDLWRFRPTTPGDYSTGSFVVLLNSPTGASIRDITLIETPLTVGGIALNPGDFLIVQSGAPYDKDIWRFVATGVGNGTTTGSFTQFLDGSDLAISANIIGMELIQQAVTIGNVTLLPGQILMNLAASDTLGDNGLVVTRFDTFVLDVTQAGTTTHATARLLFHGPDVGLATDGEEFDAIGLVGFNRAPVLTGAQDLTSIEEDAALNPGTPVFSLIAGRVSDGDPGALAGIAVVGVDNSHGLWQWTANGGAHWNNFNSPTAESALLLWADATTAVRFVPDPDWNGVVGPGLTFRAWDGTSGTAGLTADTSLNGSSTAFSTALASSSIAITPVNDPPTTPQPAAASPSIIPATTTTLSVLGADDDGEGSLTYTWSVVGQPSGASDPSFSVNASNAAKSTVATFSRAGSYSFLVTITDPGGLWTTSTVDVIVSPTLTAATIVPPSATIGVNGHLTLTAIAFDQFGEPLTTVPAWSWNVVSGAGTVDASGLYTAGPTPETATIGVSGGGISATVDIGVTNSAPVLAGTGDFTTIDEDQSDGPGDLVSDLIAGRVRDDDLLARRGIAVVSLSGWHGTWQFSLDDGVTWVPAGMVSPSSALLLRDSDRLRFVPDGIDGTTATVTFRAWDQTCGSPGGLADATVNGGSTAFSDTAAVASLLVTPVNDAPIVTAPAGRFVPAAGSVVFSTGLGTAIDVADIDAGSSPIQLHLAVGHGVLTLATTSGLTFLSGSNGTGSLTVLGTPASLHASLYGLIYTAAPSYRGRDMLIIAVDDLGNTGAGGAIVASRSVGLHVGALVVTSTNDLVNGSTASVDALVADDGGDGISLREAILAANATPGLDSLIFDLGPGGLQTIAPTTALPAITDPLTIDGTTQTGFAGIPLVVIDGLWAGLGSDGLTIVAEGCTIRGLVVSGFSGSGLRLDGSKTTVVGNAIGTDLTGALPRGNGAHGVFITSDANLIGGAELADRNWIGGNGRSGVAILGGSGNVVVGNLIGVDASGTSPRGNAVGVSVAHGSSNRIGGTVPGEGNLISGNADVGILLNGVGTTGNLVAGNLIGTNLSGHAPIPNGRFGIEVSDAADNILGGRIAATGNLISGNGAAGIYVHGTSAVGNVIQGNLIGVDRSGVAPLSNGQSGIELNEAPGNLIGGTAAGAGNVIAGNLGAGISIAGTSAMNNAIQGNWIGTDGSGNLAMGNEVGIRIVDASQTLVGGTEPGSGNVISGNHQQGIVVLTPQAVGNALLGNAIDGNVGLGIDLGGDGSTPNTLGGPHLGPNHLQNHPELVSAATNGSTLVVTGSLDAAPGAHYRVEFFVSPSTNSAGVGGGRQFIGWVDVTTDATGHAIGSAILSDTYNPGLLLTATATACDAGFAAFGDTSEFSPPVRINAAPTVATPAWANPAFVTGSATLLGVVGDDESGEATLTYEWAVRARPPDAPLPVFSLNGSNAAKRTTAAFDRPGLYTFLVTITDAGGLTATSTVDVTVVFDNVAPVNSVPGPQRIRENTTLMFSAAEGNGLSVVDVDAGANPVRVCLGVDHGRLTLATTAGLTFVSGADGTAAFSIEGTLNRINSALAALAYQPDFDFSGVDGLSIVTDDLGHSGAGGGRIDSSRVTITVDHINRPPTLTLPLAARLPAGSWLIFATATGNAIVVDDIDAATAPVQLALGASRGTLRLVTTSGLTVVSGQPEGDVSLIVRGSVAALNAALDGLRFVPPAGFVGTAWIHVGANDLNNWGVGGAGEAGGTISLRVTNQSPSLDASRPFALTPIEAGADPSSNLGTSVPDLLRSSGVDPIRDGDVGAVAGIAIVAIDASHGRWEISIDGGLHWTGLLDSGPDSATLLAATANERVRFVPRDGFVGTASLTFRAWDTTDGLPSGSTRVVLGTVGGESAYSDAVATVAETVRAPLSPTAPKPGKGNATPMIVAIIPGLGVSFPVGAGEGTGGSEAPEDGGTATESPMNQDGANGPQGAGARGAHSGGDGSNAGGDAPIDAAPAGPGNDGSSSTAAPGTATASAAVGNLSGWTTDVALLAGLPALNPKVLIRSLGALALAAPPGGRDAPADPLATPMEVFTGRFWDELDEAGLQMAESVESQVVVTVAMTGVSLSVGYVVWTGRASYLLAGLLAATPIWREIDPLVILESRQRQGGGGRNGRVVNRPRRRRGTPAEHLLSILRPHGRRRAALKGRHR